MPRFVSEFNVGLSLKLTKRKWYHLRQPLRLKLQPLPSCRWLQMKNFCCQPDRKNMKICCTEEKHRAAESREFWQILHCASDKWHWRRDADTVGCEEITCQFVSPKSFSEQNVTQLFWAGLFFYFILFFFSLQEVLLVVKACMMLLRCAQMLRIPGVPRPLASLTQNRGVFFKAVDLHSKVRPFFQTQLWQ